MKQQIFYAKKLFSLAVIFILFFACNSKNQSTTAIDNIQPDKVEITAKNNVCYLGLFGKDSIQLHVNTTNDSVSGNLNYIMAEKDNNTGTFMGKLHGDTLIADYHFTSEGIESMRQVAFILKEDKAFAGYGQMVDKDGKMYFKNSSSITFDKITPLKLVNCLP
ncbi:MAG: hypothetical protein ABI653_04415 [Bacteroidota bacterium]